MERGTQYFSDGTRVISADDLRRQEMEDRLDAADARRRPAFEKWISDHTFTTRDRDQLLARIHERFGYDDPTWNVERSAERNTMTPAERERRRGLCYLPEVNDLSEI